MTTNESQISSTLPSNTKRLLIVEDAPDLQCILKEALQSEGYQVSCSDNGLEALNTLARQATSGTLPDVILLDLMMPEMDGYEFREKQLSHEEFAQIPVIVMTAGGDSREKIDTLHADAYLKKPTDIDHLFTTIVSVAKRGKAQHTYVT